MPHLHESGISDIIYRSDTQGHRACKGDLVRPLGSARGIMYYAASTYLFEHGRMPGSQIV